MCIASSKVISIGNRGAGPVPLKSTAVSQINELPCSDSESEELLHKTDSSSPSHTLGLTTQNVMDIVQCNAIHILYIRLLKPGHHDSGVKNIETRCLCRIVTALYNLFGSNQITCPVVFLTLEHSASVYIVLPTI